MVRRQSLSRRVRANLRYLWALLKRFKVTFLLLGAVQLIGSVVIWFGHTPAGGRIPFAKAMAATYFLLMGQPTLELPDTWALVLFEALVPVLGIAVVADGLVRFGFLFFAKHRNDKEWIAVLAQTFERHVVICGAGRVGYRVLDQLRRMGVDVVVVERNENAAFVQTIRNQGVPILIDDVRSENSLAATNINRARAIVCATDDDLANLNIALDARRMNPDIRVVMRLFDDDLVRKVREAFSVDALSTSALAAPAFAALALDPGIRTSFDLDGTLMVVAELRIDPRLAGRTVAQVADAFGIGVLRLGPAADALRPVQSGDVLPEGQLAVVQTSLELYHQLRKPDAALARSA